MPEYQKSKVIGPISLYFFLSEHNLAVTAESKRANADVLREEDVDVRLIKTLEILPSASGFITGFLPPLTGGDERTDLPLRSE